MLTISMNLAILKRLIKRFGGKKRQWKITVDGRVVSQGAFQAMIILNGDLGPNLPFARGVPLGSGDFYLFAIRDKGGLYLYRLA